MDALATVPREDYVGKGPWPVFIGSGYLPTISDDPSLLYQDTLIGLVTDRKINNGQPTLHARCLAAAAPAAGETDLAERAASNLKHLANVKVPAESATEASIPPCDDIYVNAGATAGFVRSA